MKKYKKDAKKEILRNAISEVSASACSLDEFQKILMKRFNISLKISRGRFSYLHPERGKYITGRNLGTHFEESYLQAIFEENTRHSSSLSDPIFPADKSASENQQELSASVFIKSDLRLVVDLQNCYKAQQSTAYARKVKSALARQTAAP